MSCPHCHNTMFLIPAVPGETHHRGKNYLEARRHRGKAFPADMGIHQPYVPVIVPVPDPMVRPSGNPVADHLYGPEPPVAVIVVAG